MEWPRDADQSIAFPVSCATQVPPTLVANVFVPGTALSQCCLRTHAQALAADLPGFHDQPRPTLDVAVAMDTENRTPDSKRRSGTAFSCRFTARAEPLVYGGRKQVTTARGL